MEMKTDNVNSIVSNDGKVTLAKISIITINYNDAAGLKKTIESVINQSYKTIEYIVIDGGSTDNSVEVIKSYEDKIDYWISEPDNGVFDAMNKGLQVCSGDWVNFMNSADTFNNNNVLSNVVFDDSILIYGNTIDMPQNIQQPIFELKSLKYGIIMACHQAMFFNINKVKEEIYFEDGLKLFADYELVNRLWKKGYKFSYQPITIVNFLQGGLSSQISWVARRSKIYAVSKSYGIAGLIRVVLERFNLIGYQTIA